MIETYILYSTKGCHLCESAESLIRQAGIRFRCIDILDNSEHYQRYEQLIPVLAHPTNETELRWPFTLQEIIGFHYRSLSARENTAP